MRFTAPALTGRRKPCQPSRRVSKTEPSEKALGQEGSVGSRSSATDTNIPGQGGEHEAGHRQGEQIRLSRLPEGNGQPEGEHGHRDQGKPHGDGRVGQPNGRHRRGQDHEAAHTVIPSSATRPRRYAQMGRYGSVSQEGTMSPP